MGPLCLGDGKLNIYHIFTPKQLGHFYKNVILISMFAVNAYNFDENGPLQLIFSQHCGYWWPGALAPGHQ